MSITDVLRQLTYIYIGAGGIWNHVTPLVRKYEGEGGFRAYGPDVSPEHFVHNPFSWYEG